LGSNSHRQIIPSEIIKYYLGKYADFERKTFEQKRKLIQTFVESVSVSFETIDVVSIVNINGCGGRI
jgi:hypothetical protein